MPKREYGTGSLFRRKRKLSDGRVRVRWIAQVSLRDPDGTRRFVTRWRRDKASAERALDTLLRQFGLGDVIADEDQTLGTWLEQWLDDVAPTIRPSTLVSYRGHVERHIDPALGPIPLSRLRASDVRRLVSERSAAGLAPATVRLVLTTLRIALGVAVRDGIIPRNPAVGIAGPRLDRQPVEAMTQATATRILEAVEGDELEAFYVLLLAGGLRAGEACGLDWRDVDLDTGRVSIRAGKTARSVRTVVLGDRATAALRAHRTRAKRIGPREPVFVGMRSGERLRPSSALHHWQRLLADVGLPPMRLHDLRHGHATMLSALGVPIVDIAARLGHARPAMTANVYAHSQPDADRRAVDMLDRALNDG